MLQIAKHGLSNNFYSKTRKPFGNVLRSEVRLYPLLLLNGFYDLLPTPFEKRESGFALLEWKNHRSDNFDLEESASQVERSGAFAKSFLRLEVSAFLQSHRVGAAEDLQELALPHVGAYAPEIYMYEVSSDFTHGQLRTRPTQLMK